MKLRIFVVSSATIVLTVLIGNAAHAYPMGCLPPMVRNALAKADAACGIAVISTLRRGARIAGTGHVSKHAACHAADFTSRDYACVRRVLADFPGAMSIDPFAVGHVHIDNGQYLRFAHGGDRRRYAKQRTSGHRRYARSEVQNAVHPEERTP